VADRSASRRQHVAFFIVLYSLRSQLRWFTIEPFLTLGKASLQVFCTHIAFVFIGLVFLARDVGDDVNAPLEQLHGVTAIVLLAVTFTTLILVAAHQVRKHRSSRRKPPDQGAQQDSVPPLSPQALEITTIPPNL
jgi:hypothetical protein